jgi:hypothetical protein
MIRIIPDLRCASIVDFVCCIVFSWTWFLLGSKRLRLVLTMLLILNLQMRQCASHKPNLGNCHANASKQTQLSGNGVSQSIAFSGNHLLTHPGV